MAIRLSHAEYWLLDVAVEECVPVADLPNGDAAAMLNRADHRCTCEELAEALTRLFADRLITSFRQGGRRRYHALAGPEVKAELHALKHLSPSVRFAPASEPDPERVFYRLTSAGGAAWEEFARPDWGRFVDGVGTYVYGPHPHTSYRGYAICSCRSMVERYLSIVSAAGQQIDMQSIRWDVLSPWKATYWKTLPLAHRARFKGSERANVPAEESQALLEVFGRFRRWYPWHS